MLRTRHVSLAMLCAIAGTMFGCGTNMQEPTASKPASAPQSSNAALATVKGPMGRHIMAAFGPTGKFTDTGNYGNAAHGDVFFRNALGVRGNALTEADFLGIPTGLSIGAQIQTNGRSCASCHIAADNFSLTPRAANRARSNDPLIREVMADAAPGDNPLTLLRELRRHGLIRVAFPAPLNPGKTMKMFRAVPAVASAAFSVDVEIPDYKGDPVDFFIMWDGREPSLENQAGSATLGHAQSVFGQSNVLDNSFPTVRDQLNKKITKDIATFQRNIGLSHMSGIDPRQITNADLITPASDVSQFPVVKNRLGQNIVEHLPEYVANKLLVSPNQLPDPVLKDIFDQYVPQLSYNSLSQREKDGFRAYVGTKQKPGCIICHNVPGTLAGGSVQFEEVAVSFENKHRLPTDRLTLKDKHGNYVISKKTPDAGLAIRTGLLEDFEKFRVPSLLNIKKMDRFFHDNHELSIGNMINHYREAFPTLFELNNGEKRDLRAFLERL